jgi:hypothetical protein
LVAIKARLSNWVLDKLKATMVEKARLENMAKSDTCREQIERFENMVVPFKNDSSDANHKTAFHVATGQFEFRPANKLFSQWESEYMDKLDVWICDVPEELNKTINRRKDASTRSSAPPR